MPEWAIAASVLIGLSLARFLILSCVIILALAPSLLVLALVLGAGARSQ